MKPAQLTLAESDLLLFWTVESTHVAINLVVAYEFFFLCVCGHRTFNDTFCSKSLSCGVSAACLWDLETGGYVLYTL